MSSIVYRVVIKYGANRLCGRWESFEACQKNIALLKCIVVFPHCVNFESSEDIEE